MRRPAIALLSLLVSTPAWAEDCSLEGLHWLQGAWGNTAVDTAGEERWVLLPGGALAGSAWETAKDGTPHFVEALSLSLTDGKVTLRMRHFDGTLARAWEDKMTPVTFTATRCGPGDVVFEGVGGHAGERITYARTKDRLSFVGEFIHKGKPHRVDLEMSRTGD
ncbi:DUF6265 family protein [Nitrospirillum amazonense]|uniref:DUF6265 domain-containing protein n=1 Tax=Nitrospirillum amazonense TaxID=28077 RepID=A0A560JVT2_9PROT|nr:DUF6265 family protein [Nitrospirillum amazonense]MDG3440502.1 DUF6265 family protein [Nitrospirillum amazonense]TWB75161.1 hypothetical protein FBZ87_104261 [Nitrospirillum amazonense]